MRRSFTVVIDLVAERKVRTVGHRPAERGFHPPKSFKSAVEFYVIQFFDREIVVKHGVFSRGGDIQLQHGFRRVGIGGERGGHLSVSVGCTRHGGGIHPKISVFRAVAVALILPDAKRVYRRGRIGAVIKRKKIRLSARHFEFGAVHHPPYHAVARLINAFQRISVMRVASAYHGKRYVRYRFVFLVQRHPRRPVSGHVSRQRFKTGIGDFRHYVFRRRFIQHAETAAERDKRDKRAHKDSESLYFLETESHYRFSSFDEFRRGYPPYCPIQYKLDLTAGLCYFAAFQYRPQCNPG